jgi:hypothetical protein
MLALESVQERRDGFSRKMFLWSELSDKLHVYRCVKDTLSNKLGYHFLHVSFGTKRVVWFGRNNFPQRFAILSSMFLQRSNHQTSGTKRSGRHCKQRRPGEWRKKDQKKKQNKTKVRRQTINSPQKVDEPLNSFRINEKIKVSTTRLFRICLSFFKFFVSFLRSFCVR